MSTLFSSKTGIDLEPETRTAAATDKKKPLAAGHALSERYRCPEEFLSLDFDDSVPLSSGFFRVGPRAIGYGRSSSEGSSPDAQLPDALSRVATEGTRLRLPFHPTEVIENLRLERYAAGQSTNGNSNRFLKELYYRLRPFISLKLRKRVQRFHNRNWKQRVFPRWPVDTSVEDICETVLLHLMQARKVDGVPFIWFWPKGAHGCVTMTHDVETASGRDFCGELMNVDDSFGVKAAYGIVPEVRYEVSCALIQSIWKRGCEVVVQDLNHDGRLFDDKEEFLRRAKLINRYGREFGAKGFRAGVLYRKPDWYYALEFAHDMSIPNVAHLDPQRGGCCTVMPFFIGDVLELPVTTTQDYTLWHILGEHSTELWKSQIDLILEKKGLASFIVHPDYLLEPERLSAYKALLQHLRDIRDKKNLWFALPLEIDEWWRARSRMSVVPDSNGWRIEGAGADRAVLAYAKNCDGRLVYELECAASS